MVPQLGTPGRVHSAGKSPQRSPEWMGTRQAATWRTRRGSLRWSLGRRPLLKGDFLLFFTRISLLTMLKIPEADFLQCLIFLCYETVPHLASDWLCLGTLELSRILCFLVLFFSHIKNIRFVSSYVTRHLQEDYGSYWQKPPKRHPDSIIHKFSPTSKRCQRAQELV